MRIAYIGQKGIGQGKAGGGVEYHVHKLAVGMAARGHEVTVYARGSYESPKGVIRPGITERRVPTIATKNLDAIVSTFFATLDALVRPYDIIHYHGVGPATLAFLPRLFKPHTKIIATFHSQDRFHAKWGWFARLYLRFGEWAACHFPHRTIVVSRTMQASIKKTFGTEAVYIPNGATIHEGKGTDALSTFGLVPDAYLLNVSRLVPHKGQRLLIDAFLELKSRHVLPTGFKLVLVGAASFLSGYEQELHERAKGDSDILFLGFQQGEVLAQLYAHAACYVQPSESEGLALTVLKAMSFGTCVLTSDIPENRELAQGAGFLFENRNKQALVAELTRVLADAVMRKQAGRLLQQRVAQEYQWEEVIHNTETLYRSL